VTFTASMPNLYSRDVAAAAGFYRDLLGFSQTYQYPPDGAPRHVELRLGGSLLAISSLDAVADMGLPPTSAGHNHELVVWCDDMDAAIARLRAAGAPILIEPHSHVAGHRRAYVADPDGHWLALVQE
jgi:catechol 2,3-dioxygenase-like lactoylglutathione lyase family enzyme